MIILGEIRKDKSTAKDDAIRISELVIDVKKLSSFITPIIY